jgi:hypothetical protein
VSDEVWGHLEASRPVPGLHRYVRPHADEPVEAIEAVVRAGTHMLPLAGKAARVVEQHGGGSAGGGAGGGVALCDQISRCAFSFRFSSAIHLLDMFLVYSTLECRASWAEHSSEGVTVDTKEGAPWAYKRRRTMGLPAGNPPHSVILEPCVSSIPAGLAKRLSRCRPALTIGMVRSNQGRALWGAAQR